MRDTILDIATFRNTRWDMGIEVTERATRALRGIMRDNGLDPCRSWIRLADCTRARRGGLECALDFEHGEPHGSGRAWMAHGLRFVADECERNRLDGATLDYSDGLLAHGFVLTAGRRSAREHQK